MNVESDDDKYERFEPVERSEGGIERKGAHGAVSGQASAARLSIDLFLGFRSGTQA